MRALSDNNLTKDLVVHKGSDVIIDTQLEEKKNARGSDYRNN